MALPQPASDSPAGPDESLDSAILRLLMENIPDRIYFKDRQSRFVRVNRAHAKWLGAASPEAVVGKTDFDFFARDHATAAYTEEQRIIESGQPLLGEIQFITRQDGRTAWGSTSKLPWRDASGRIIGTFGLTRDVTAAKQAEEKLTEEHNLLRTIIDHLPSRIFVKDSAARYLLNNEAHLRELGVARQEEAKGRTVREFYSGQRAEQSIADDHSVLSGGPPVINQEKSDYGSQGNSHWWITTKVPLQDIRGKIIGLVGISHDITQRKRTEQELQRRSAEMEADVLMARQIQQAFIPRTYPVFPAGSRPETSALHFAHRYIAATTLGGDFFDLVPISDSRCGLLICDVMGHGVRAGLLTALIRGVVEECCIQIGDPGRVLGEINRALMPIVRETGQPIFATAFYGVIDLSASSIRYAIAGHPPPFHVRPGREKAVALALTDPEPAAGLIEGFEYSHRELEFLPGDVLLAYTDGIVEASNADGKMFGDERLRALIEEHPGGTPSDWVERIVGQVTAFTGRNDFEDDICIVAAEFTAKGTSVSP
jgi:sigma-B regulation protein RsbU (phosphoserine phosphatase)